MKLNPYVVLIATSGLMFATVAFAEPAVSASPEDVTSGTPTDGSIEDAIAAHPAGAMSVAHSVLVAH
jgi:hypothetical protein